MGCHTWIYKKVREVSEEEQKQIIQDSYEYYSKPYTFRMFYTPEFYEAFRKRRKYSKEWVKKTYESIKEIHEQYAELLKGKTSFKELQDCHFPMGDLHSEDISLGFGSNNILRGNKVYSELDFDIPLRVFGYPEETFTDRDKLLQWLSTRNPAMIGYYNDNREFVSGFTQELYNRIYWYFEEHKDDELYIEFG